MDAVGSFGGILSMMGFPSSLSGIGAGCVMMETGSVGHSILSDIYGVMEKMAYRAVGNFMKNDVRVVNKLR